MNNPTPTGLPAERKSIRRRPLTREQVLILAAAFASFVVSVSLWFAGSKDQGMFVGLWVPSILALGAFLTARKGGSPS